VALIGGAVQAQSDAGAQEYVQACASCHGLTGHGDGPLAEFMTVEVPDVTQIALNNDGEFPMLQVIQIIDGRTGVRGNGYPMPVWGDRFEAQMPDDIGTYSTELMVRGRILALATHLEAIQE
jgi:mono/diheme cytochrome c family protein